MHAHMKVSKYPALSDRELITPTHIQKQKQLLIVYCSLFLADTVTSTSNVLSPEVSTTLQHPLQVAKVMLVQPDHMLAATMHCL